MNHSESILRARDQLLADKGRFLESTEDLTEELAHWNDSETFIAGSVIERPAAERRREIANEAVQALTSILAMYWTNGRRPMTIEETAVARLLDRITRPMVETLADELRAEPADDSERRLDERDRARDMNATMRGML